MPLRPSRLTQRPLIVPPVAPVPSGKSQTAWLRYVLDGRKDAFRQPRAWVARRTVSTSVDDDADDVTRDT
jgi:hypothetical protein